MTELLNIPILPLILTLAAFQVGRVLQAKFRSPFLNPILIAVILVLIFLFATGMPVAEYQQGTESISWLLTPATICLAIPMYEQFQVLKKNLPMILVIAFLLATGMNADGYTAGMGKMSWLMTPATICLAIPMYEQFQVLKKSLKAILAGVCAGTLSCLLVITAGAFLTGIMSVLFGSPAVGIVSNWELTRPQLLPICLLIVASTVITFGISGGVTQLLQRKGEKRHD